jgi:hypothetical protein
MPLPQPMNEPDENTLPDPELNPLLNPLLAAHMGRWAEVYFTTPPDQRGHAISQLLRELESMPPAESGPVRAIPVQSIPVQSISDERSGENLETPEARGHFSSELSSAEFSSPELSASGHFSTTESVLTCSACAHPNSTEQRFCGMCGAALQFPPEPLLWGVAEAQAITRSRSVGSQHFHEETPDAHAAEPIVSSVATPEDRNAWEPIRPAMENDLPSFAVEREPVPYRYRLYAGVGLAILFAALGYTAWHRTSDRPSAAAPLMPSAATAPAVSAAAKSSPQPPASASPSTTSDSQASAAAGRAATGRTVSDEPSSREQAPAAARPGARIVPVTSTSSAIVTGEQSGAEELATAEKYLSGAPGTARDSSEAAQWLWKAVRKRNLTATIALSDLYLRGDGVSKSCDQARLLLDAAARQGGTAAAERIRNLQAFGCQ